MHDYTNVEIVVSFSAAFQAIPGLKCCTETFYDVEIIRDTQSTYASWYIYALKFIPKLKAASEYVLTVTWGEVPGGKACAVFAT